MPNLLIRPATPSDAHAFADAYLDSADHHRALDAELYRRPDESAARDRYSEEIAALEAQSHREATVLVAEEEGSVVGAIWIRLRRPHPASMQRPELSADLDIAVRQGSRDRGVGSALMAAAEAWAMERGAALMMLDANAANERAIRFYRERHGFRTTGVIMTKRLDPRD